VVIVNGEEIKKAYLKLSDEERREVAHWVLARELSGRAGSSFKPSLTEQPKQCFSLLKKAACVVLFVGLVLGGLGAGLHYWETQKKASERKSLAEKAAEEAKRPHSPTNLEFLTSQVGNEITIRGIPRDSEIGYLYFSKEWKQGMRLNFFSGGVVLIQSGDLQELVRDEQELEISGLLEKTDEGFYEIKVGSVNRLKKIGN
jgi:hypothetical protein